MEASEFKIADIDEKVKEEITKAENQIKAQTGKDLVMIAWEKK